MKYLKLYLLAVSSLFLTENLFAQTATSVQLRDLQKQARDHYPLLRQQKAYRDLSDNKIRQINTDYLPQAAVVGNATYQSEVTEFPGAQFTIAPDQYAAGIEVKENLLYDGSLVKQKQLERENGELQSQQVEAELLKLKERVNTYFGTLYLQQENKKIMELRIDELEAKKSKVKSAVDNGAALRSNYLVLESEVLAARQRIDEINSNRISLCKSLSLLTGQEIDTSVVFEVNNDIALQSEVKRPEYRIFELQANSLSLREELINRNNLPKLFVYGRGYYGRPGYNFLNNDFRTYGIVGAGLNWNLSAYYNSGKQKSALHLNNDILNSQKEIFDINLRTTIVQQQEEINKLEKMVISDEQIATARAEVRRISSSQLDNGVITSADYIVDLNADNQARYNLQLHKVQLLMAKENYNTTLGY